MTQDKQFLTPIKWYMASRLCINPDTFDKEVIWQTVHSFYDRREYPKLLKVLEVFKEKTVIKGELFCLWKILHEIGFNYKKRDNKQYNYQQRTDFYYLYKEWTKNFWHEFYTYLLSLHLWNKLALLRFDYSLNYIHFSILNCLRFCTCLLFTCQPFYSFTVCIRVLYKLIKFHVVNGIYCTSAYG